jgi:hypothetical protein
MWIDFSNIDGIPSGCGPCNTKNGWISILTCDNVNLYSITFLEWSLRGCYMTISIGFYRWHEVELDFVLLFQMLREQITLCKEAINAYFAVYIDRLSWSWTQSLIIENTGNYIVKLWIWNVKLILTNLVIYQNES